MNTTRHSLNKTMQRGSNWLNKLNMSNVTNGGRKTGGRKIAEVKKITLNRLLSKNDSTKP